MEVNKGKYKIEKEGKFLVQDNQRSQIKKLATRKRKQNVERVKKKIDMFILGIELSNFPLYLKQYCLKMWKFQD